MSAESARSSHLWFMLPRKRNGEFWLNPPKRILQRLEKKLVKLRKPTGFDGVIYEIVKDGHPYINYGEVNGLLSNDRLIMKKKASPELCKRCGGEVNYVVKSGKRRKSHKLRDCSLILVEKMMND